MVTKKPKGAQNRKDHPQDATMNAQESRWMRRTVKTDRTVKTASRMDVRFASEALMSFLHAHADSARIV